MKISLKNSILSWAMKSRMSQIELFLDLPFLTQDKLRLQLLEKAKDTIFGKDHNFSSIKSYKDFCTNIPVRTYEDIFPYIQKIRNGENNVLWPGKIKWFAKSSGTTNAKSKFIPISEDALEDCHYKAGKDMLAIYCNNHPETNIFNGKSLMLGGSQEKNLNKKYLDGDLSAILLNNFPFWISMHRVPDLKTALLDEWEEKLNRIVYQSINENITNLIGASSWMLIVLNKILKEKNIKNILEVWPNLELFIHGGMNFSPYKEQFKRIIPKYQMNYMECYNASEGYFAIQDQADSEEMLLMLDYGIFFEFIPIDEFKKDKMHAISLEMVELNKYYAIVISTNTGLWRYLIGDTIKFTNLNPFRIKIVGRTKHFMNIFGEEIVIENAESALAFACKESSAIIKEYTAAPIYIEGGNSGAHQWLIEFKKEPDNFNYFAKKLDAFLKKVNSDYQAKRTKNLVLKMPEIKTLRPGTFYKWLNSKGKLGGQNKVPRLSNNREIANELLKLQ